MFGVTVEASSKFIITASGDELSDIRKAAKIKEMNTMDYIADVLVSNSERLVRKEEKE